MQYFNPKSMELEKNLVSAVKNFHNMDLIVILGIEQDNRRKLDGAKLGGEPHNLTLWRWLKIQF